MGLKKRSLGSSFLEDQGYMMGLGKRKRMQEMVDNNEKFLPTLTLGSRY